MSETTRRPTAAASVRTVEGDSARDRSDRVVLKLIKGGDIVNLRLR